MRDTVFILCRAKYRNTSSYHLMNELKARGINAYRVLATRVPRRAVERCFAVVNWGVSATPIWAGRLHPSVRWYNSTETVHLSANKRLMSQALARSAVPHLETTTSRSVAEQWMGEEHTVVTRTILTGCRGAGIVLSPPDPLPQARLYTKLYRGPRTREYRAYIVGGQVIDLTEKRRWSVERTDAAGIDRNDPYTKLIRCNGNGWVFARHNLDATPAQQAIIRQRARDAADSIDLGVGAVDLIAKYSSTANGRELLGVVVVETNTSVSLVGDRNTRSIMASRLAYECSVYDRSI